MNRPGKPHALLSTARVANIPSVVSNVWVGAAMVLAVNNRMDDTTPMDVQTIPWSSVNTLMLAAISLYVAGNFLNDWMDRDWDAKHRPERALPSGLFTPTHYRNSAVVLAIAGLVLATWVNWLAGMIAFGILANIVIYTIWHKRGAWTVIPMGMCRGLLPMLGALGMIGMPTDSTTALGVCLLSGFLGSGLFFHIAGLSLSARGESKESPSSNDRSLPLVLFALTASLMLAPGFLTKNVSWLMFVAPVPYVMWLVICRTIHRRPVSRYVSALLAGIPLVDWIVMLPFSLSALYQTTPRLPQHPLEWVCLTLPPLAFLSALLLQRLAPAT